MEGEMEACAEWIDSRRVHFNFLLYGFRFYFMPLLLLCALKRSVCVALVVQRSGNSAVLLSERGTKEGEADA